MTTNTVNTQGVQSQIDRENAVSLEQGLAEVERINRDRRIAIETAQQLRYAKEQKELRDNEDAWQSKEEEEQKELSDAVKAGFAQIKVESDWENIPKEEITLYQEHLDQKEERGRKLDRDAKYKKRQFVSPENSSTRARKK
jgi:hypothetical protein